MSQVVINFSDFTPCDHIPRRDVEHADFIIRVADRAPLLVNLDIDHIPRVVLDIVSYIALQAPFLIGWNLQVFNAYVFRRKLDVGSALPYYNAFVTDC